MGKIAYSVVLLAGVVLFVSTPSDDLISGLISGIFWGIGGIGLVVE